MVNEKLLNNTEKLIAFEFGRLAFKKGTIRAPCQDSNVMNMLEGMPIGDKQGIAIMKAWSNGWDVENLKAPV